MTEQREDGRAVTPQEREERMDAIRQIIDEVSDRADRWASLADQRADRMKDLLREVEELRAKVARYESTAPIVVDDSHLSDDDLRRLRQVLGESRVTAGRIEIVTTHPEVESLRAQNAELLEAARKAVAWIWDPEENPDETFERIAKEFYHDTGFLRPGKDGAFSSEVGQRERNAAWEKWRTERSIGVLNGLRAAIAKAKGGDS